MTCKICRSPNRAIFERMFLDDRMQVKEIFRIAKEKYNEPVSYSTFKKHFREDVVQLIEVCKSVDRLKRKKIEEEFKRDIQAAQTFRKYLITINDNIDALFREVKETGERSDRKLLLDFISKGIDAIEKLLRWGEQLGYQPDTYDMEERIMYCMIDFPVEYIKQFKKNWDNYER